MEKRKIIITKKKRQFAIKRFVRLIRANDCFLDFLFLPLSRENLMKHASLTILTCLCTYHLTIHINRHNTTIEQKTWLLLNLEIRLCIHFILLFFLACFSYKIYVRTYPKGMWWMIHRFNDGDDFIILKVLKYLLKHGLKAAINFNFPRSGWEWFYRKKNVFDGFPQDIAIASNNLFWIFFLDEVMMMFFLIFSSFIGFWLREFGGCW